MKSHKIDFNEGFNLNYWNKNSICGIWLHLWYRFQWEREQFRVIDEHWTKSSQVKFQNSKLGKFYYHLKIIGTTRNFWTGTIFRVSPDAQQTYQIEGHRRREKTAV